MTLPRIFVGGVGRSGTTILHRALGCHANVFSFPHELRFLIDPDGLMNLLDALTWRYSRMHAREALYRFETLMRVHLTTPGIAPYRDFDLANWLGGDYYWRRLDQFCDQLVELEYTGRDWIADREKEGRLVSWVRDLQRLRKLIRGRPVLTPAAMQILGREKLRLGKYFPDRSELVSLAASFVEDLFLHTAQLNGKETWCEKSPVNLLHLDFLAELFPDSVFLIIHRDPRGLVYSHAHQRWGPHSIESASLFIKSPILRWYDIRCSPDFSKYRCLELKLEELAANPERVLAKVAAFCGLPDHFVNLPLITLDKVDYWRTAMTESEIQTVNYHLGEMIEWMGYDMDTKMQPELSLESGHSE